MDWPTPSLITTSGYNLGKLGTNEQKIFKKLWDISFSLWDHRCKTLHDTENVINEHAHEILDKALAKEWNVVPTCLLPLAQRSFDTARGKLLNYNSLRKKAWFTTVRAAREMRLGGAIQDDL